MEREGGSSERQDSRAFQVTCPAPLQSVEELLRESREPKALGARLGLPHPLQKFCSNGRVKDCPQADMIVDCIESEAFEKPYSIRWRSSRWFLLESTMFFEACEVAGIDGRKLRRHLRRVCRVIDHWRSVHSWQR